MRAWTTSGRLAIQRGTAPVTPMDGAAETSMRFQKMALSNEHAKVWFQLETGNLIVPIQINTHEIGRTGIRMVRETWQILFEMLNKWHHEASQKGRDERDLFTWTGEVDASLDEECEELSRYNRRST